MNHVLQDIIHQLEKKGIHLNVSTLVKDSVMVEMVIDQLQRQNIIPRLKPQKAQKGRFDQLLEALRETGLINVPTVEEIKRLNTENITTFEQGLNKNIK